MKDTMVLVTAAHCSQCGDEASLFPPFGSEFPATVTRTWLHDYVARIPHSADCDGQMLIEHEPVPTEESPTDG